MFTNHGRRALSAAATSACVAALIAAGPAPAAAADHPAPAHAECNALLPDAAAIGSLGAARTAAGRGGLRPEPAIPATDIDVPEDSVPIVGGSFSATVPVYFHVINTGPKARDGNVPDSRIRAQIDVLNRTFAGALGGADTGFRFRLAGVDRTTNPEWFAMTTSLAEREAKEALHRGGRNALNVYTNDGAGFLGWAYYPKSVRGRSTLDGVVLAHGSLPGGSIENYDRGYTATHEVGHWLGIAHTFQNGCSETGDGVDDTPAQRFPTTGCPVGQDSCPADPGPDPIHNFMDYSYDDCYQEFTAGQARRMAEQWLYFRAPGTG